MVLLVNCRTTTEFFCFALTDSNLIVNKCITSSNILYMNIVDYNTKFQLKASLVLGKPARGYMKN